ncbi:MAG: hypothetical protein GY851_03265 [bacterium]|nr:hypothetical protein [bacterium]
MQLQGTTADATRWVIACSKRGDPSTTLFMVDRRRQWASFWSDRLTDVFVYTNRKAAESKAAALRYNTPRVLTLDEARVVADAQADPYKGVDYEVRSPGPRMEAGVQKTRDGDFRVAPKRPEVETFQAPEAMDERWANIELPEDDT